MLTSGLFLQQNMVYSVGKLSNEGLLSNYLVILINLLDMGNKKLLMIM